MRFLIGISLAAICCATPALAADNEDVNPQVTDAVTQANVKVVGQSPAMAMGNLYQANAHSMGLLLNKMPGTIEHSARFTNLGVQQIYSVDTAAAATSTRSTVLRQDTKAKVYRKIDAIAARLDDCGDACLLNLHLHVGDPLKADPSDETPSAACDIGSMTITTSDLPESSLGSPAELLATCIVARMEANPGVQVEGIAWVVPDDPASSQAWQEALVTRVDLFVQQVP